MNKLYDEESIKDIADAIREKNGTTDTYKVGEMGKAIRTLSATTEVDYDMSTVSWEVGTINQTGAVLVNNYRIRTTTAISLPKDTVISCNQQLNMDIAVYNNSGFVEKRGFSKEDYTTKIEGQFKIVLYDDAGTRYGDSEDYVTAAAKNVTIKYKKVASSDDDNDSSIENTKKQDAIPRTILPYEGYLLSSTTSEDSNAPIGNNLSNLYSKWDNLLTLYPNNIKKEVLGIANDYEIRCYTITSNSDQYKWTIKNPQTNLKILWLSGVHGHEYTIFIDDLKFFTELLKQDNEVTARLMDNCTFKVIPACCPWGYQNSKRVNKNGVNINRNFEKDWTLSGEGTNDYSGATAMSEDETKIISQFLQDNKDCYMAINRHSSSDFSPTSVLGYFVSQFEVDRKLAYNMCRFMSNQIKRSDLYTYIKSSGSTDADSRCLQTVESSTATGTLDKYFNSIGIHGFLYEASPYNKVGDDYYSEDWGRNIWQRINVTNIGNLLYALMLQNEYII